MRTHSSPGTRLIALGATALAAAAAAFLLTGAPAHAAGPMPAHVQVSGEASPGSTATLTFTVPTESDTASTVSVEVELPAETPFTSVRAEAKPGWDVEIVHSELDPPVVVGDLAIKSYISAVRWTATDGGIAPDEYDTFTIKAGAIPSGVEALTLPTTQGYDDGSSVAWADAGTHDGQESTHPAPVIAIAAPEEPADPALGIGVTALVIGAVAIAGVAILAARSLRRRQH